MRIDIKPLSVNKAFKGRRYRTKEYDIYEKQIKMFLQRIDIPKGKLSVSYSLGVSNSGFDIDNCIKPFQDILSKHYCFNDNTIYHIEIRKYVVPKGKEYIQFEILPIK